MIEALDHVNIRTGQVEAMIAWYTEVLGLEHGYRPDFPFPGAWLYANGKPMVHLVGTDQPPSEPGKDAKLEHGAFRASGMSEFLSRLKARAERYELNPLDQVGLIQVHVWDPDGNHLHIDFAAEEEGATA